MTEEGMDKEAAPKGKSVSVIRWIVLAAISLLMILTVVMAAYRKFAG